MLPHIRGPRLAALLGASLGLAGCSNHPVPPRSDMVDGLVSAGIPRKEATCATDAIYDSLSRTQVSQLIDRGAGGVPKDDPSSTNDATDKLTRALAKCQAAASTDTVPTTVPPEALTTLAVSDSSEWPKA